MHSQNNNRYAGQKEACSHVEAVAYVELEPGGNLMDFV